MNVDRKTYITTFTGTKFHFLNPTVDEVNIMDIAHALANKCRWSGHTKQFYSVAQHSLEVSEHLPSDLALTGLLHDASEAYLVDLPRPIKKEILRDGHDIFAELEGRIQKIIAEKYEVEYPTPEKVKLVDDEALLTEIRDLMPPCDDWLITTDAEPWKGTLTPRTPTKAKAKFLERFIELGGNG